MNKQVLIEADSVEEARKQIEHQLTQGIILHSTKILNDGKPVSIDGGGDTTKDAFAELEKQVPGEATILERTELYPTGQRIIVIEAVDEQTARKQASQQIRYDEEIDEIILLDGGKKGVLGLWKKPNSYEIRISYMACVQLTYIEKAKVRFTIGPKGLIEAVKALDLQEVRDALEAGAAINVTNDGGYTPLMLAALRGSEEIVELLISKGANVNAATKWGATALTRAAQEGDIWIVELLLSNGADINQSEYDGYTALSRAAMNGHEQIVKMLLSNRADLNISTKHGHTALTLALENRHSRIAELLQDAS